MVVFETNRLIIREHTQEDIEKLFAILSDPVTMSFWPSPLTSDQVSEWVTINIKNYHDLGFGRWAIILKEDNQFIGDCGIKLASIDGTIENDLGYIIDHHHWKKGYAMEAAAACKEYALGKLQMKRLCANMAVDHIRSKNVAIKLGMSLEKIFNNQRNRNLPTYLFAYNVPDEQ
ncbi:GNAT family N-acetyltransferase [Brevibacillus sp. SYSU BS000544]|uniref:GNAT family N-acetyltransferase n=1 Tax=Brevibacillus sp. SYSU BS000544 TaxID=3416443 RepID=UPI003CE50DE8